MHQSSWTRTLMTVNTEIDAPEKDLHTRLLMAWCCTASRSSQFFCILRPQRDPVMKTCLLFGCCSSRKATRSNGRKTLGGREREQIACRKLLLAIHWSTVSFYQRSDAQRGPRRKHLMRLTNKKSTCLPSTEITNRALTRSS